MDVIKELGLESKVRDFWNELRGDFDRAILLKDIREAIEKFPVVYSQGRGSSWSGKHISSDTHKARLLGVEKLVKEPMRVERQFLNEKPDYCYGSIEVPSQIKGKTFKVVFEEVIE